MDMAIRSVVLLVMLAICSFHVSGDSRYISLPSAGDTEAVIPNRHLLQVLTPCSVNFQVQNYTIITSECKGPQYPANACCAAFVKFACPFFEELNDNTTDCANTMFNYINIYGRYPSGLFANECRGDDKGLPCPGNSTAPNTNGARDVKHSQQLWWLVSIISTIVLFNLHGGGPAF
ncbi:hypothetical protein GOP47_0018716 [Adiantum capillus-veneris]|uniref:GPI-anchored protein LLG1-like domain-containing protein n=1 Tax=Adiantum capillus-veneris TaxID=13818 RepID=A0A9D4UE85_ADICA|nr:hypothetical protein GOP47_0018716 [Adiantum capillus-veneris]